MYRVALVVAVLAVLAAVSLTSCTKPVEPETEVTPVAEPGMLPEPPEETPPPVEADAEPAAEMDADAVVAEVGAPLYEGAESEAVTTEDGVTKATFTTPAAYKDVKDFYLAELTVPDWTNNGFEMGAMGGDEWEFKSADGTRLVLVKRDSGASATEIRFTLKPTEE